MVMTRFRRRQQEAMNGDEIEVLKTYDKEIEALIERQRLVSNAYVRLCLQQEINQLRIERRTIEEEVV